MYGPRSDERGIYGYERIHLQKLRELALFFNAETVAKVLRDAPSTACELMHEAGFSTLKIGNGIVDPKEQFIAWVQHHTEGAVR